LRGFGSRCGYLGELTSRARVHSIRISLWLLYVVVVNASINWMDVSLAIAEERWHRLSEFAEIQPQPQLTPPWMATIIAYIQLDAKLFFNIDTWS
jgi:hypothetical protein